MLFSLVLFKHQPWQLWHRLWTLSSLMHFLLTIALFLAYIKVISFIVDLIDHNRRFDFFFICRLMFFPLILSSVNHDTCDINCELYFLIWLMYLFSQYICLIFCIILGKLKGVLVKRNNNNWPEQSSFWPVPIAAFVSQDIDVHKSLRLYDISVSSGREEKGRVRRGVNGWPLSENID